MQTDEETSFVALLTDREASCGLVGQIQTTEHTGHEPSFNETYLNKNLTELYEHTITCRAPY